MRLSVEGRNKLLGLAFILLSLTAVGLLIAKFQQQFDTTPTVTLQVPTSGSQLNDDADVKIRGLIVGRVTEQKVRGDIVDLTLAIPRRDMALIPKDVKARLLPKTLFGEKYVDLAIPAGTSASAAHLVPGDTIPIDQSAEALELERVLANFTYLLRELQPVKVNTFLTNLSGALADNGEKLGQTIVQFDKYARSIEPNIGKINEDISGLADLAQSLDVNSSDLLEIARNAATTGKTITAKNDDLANFLRGTAGFAQTGTEVFRKDGDALITIAANSREQLEAAAALRGNIPSGVRNLNEAVKRIVEPGKGAIAQGPYMNLRLYPQSSRGKYTKADCAKFPGQSAPYCSAGILGGSSKNGESLIVDPDGDKDTLHRLLGPLLGVAPDQVSGVADLLLGGLLRGSSVAVQ